MVMVDGERKSIPIAELTDEELKTVGAEWIDKLVRDAQEKRVKKSPRHDLLDITKARIPPLPGMWWLSFLMEKAEQ
jgi:hypothetical protein